MFFFLIEVPAGASQLPRKLLQFAFRRFIRRQYEEMDYSSSLEYQFVIDVYFKKNQVMILTDCQYLRNQQMKD